MEMMHLGPGIYPYHLSGMTMPVVMGDAHIGNGSSAVTLIGIMVSRASDIQLQHCMCDLKAIKSRFKISQGNKYL